MKQYKIIYDISQKEPWNCYCCDRDGVLSYFFDNWIFCWSVSTQDEALMLVKSEEGRFLGFFDKKGSEIKDYTNELSDFKNIFIN